ncbi:MAG: hypothetical protein ACP5M9_00385 [Candidatus Micrarchaeia archaeon]
MNRKTLSNSVRNRCNGNYLFFIKPKYLKDAKKIAHNLINIGSVNEVILTSGQYGFVVKCNSEKSEKELCLYIKRNVGDISKLECHYSYIKTI